MINEVDNIWSMDFFGSLFYLGLYFYLIDNVFFKIGDESEEIILLLVNG